MRVPFLDLTRAHEPIAGELEDAVLGVMRSGRYILGDVVERFERELADYCGVKHAVGVASGTDALELTLRAVDAASTVQVPAFTFGGSVSAIEAAGYCPEMCDIYGDTFTADFVHAGFNMPIDLYGQHNGYQREPGCYGMVQDSAQGIGLPVTGDAACLSFFPTKNLGAMGDGGAVLTNSDEIAEKVRLLRAHGSKRKYHHEIVGTNSRLDAIQAAILSVKLKYLDGWTARRREIAERYTDVLKDVPGILCPVAVREHVWNQYTIRILDGVKGTQVGAEVALDTLNRRDDVKERLAAAGIGTMVYYPEPLHVQPAFARLGYHEGDFPNAERACREVLSLPIYPGLTDGEQDAVVEGLKIAVRR